MSDDDQRGEGGGDGRHLIPLLSSVDNYPWWRMAMQDFLVEKDLFWTTRTPEPDAQGAAQRKWARANERAVGFMRQYLHPSIKMPYGEQTNAMIFWTTLQAAFARGSYSSRVHLIVGLFTCRYQGGDMRQHLTRIQEFAIRLKATGRPVEVDLIIGAMICSLPPSYAGVIQLLEGVKIEEMTVEYAVGKIEDEYLRVHRTKARSPDTKGSKSAPKEGAALQATAARTGKGHRRRGKVSNTWSYATPQQRQFDGPRETRTCHHCGKQGHLRTDCRKLKAELADNPSTSLVAVSRCRPAENQAYAFRIDTSINAATLSKLPDRQRWLLDSGASHHVTPDATAFATFSSNSTPPVRMANGQMEPSTGTGRIHLLSHASLGNFGKIVLQDVIHVPTLQFGLISVHQLATVNGYTVSFVDSRCKIEDKFGKLVGCGVADPVTRQYFLVQPVNPADYREDPKATTCTISTSLYKWHCRLGHRDPVAVQRLVTDRLATGINIQPSNKHIDCDVCAQGKMSATRFVSPAPIRSTRPGELAHSDVCGPISPTSFGGCRFFLTITDDFSRWTVVRPLKTKGAAAEEIKRYVRQVKAHFGRSLSTFRSDNGREYVNRDLQDFFKAEGIVHQLTVPYTPQQNGVAERKNRTLCEMARTMLQDSALSKVYWAEAISYSAYILNMLPTRSVERTPFERWRGQTPDVGHIRAFGSKVHCLLPFTAKWDSKVVTGVLVGFSDVTKGYRVLDPSTGRVWVSRSVKIIEKVIADGLADVTTSEENDDDVDLSPFPPSPPRTSSPKTPTQSKSEGEESEEAFDTLPNDGQGAASDNESDTTIINFRDATASNDSSQMQTSPPAPRARRGRPTGPAPPPPPRQRPLSTRNRVQPDKYVSPSFAVLTTGSRAPSDWKSVLNLPERERRQWTVAAKQEMDSMKKLHVWDLVPLPPGRRAITSRWVFKEKTGSEGQQSIKKARLVARGFTQHYGCDYDATFSPVVRLDTVRVLLAVAASRHLHVRHLDVNTAYLNAELEEEIYMEQPEGFVSRAAEDHVLRLRKSLYGLKQSARQWNRKATASLIAIGFKQGAADPCLFTRFTNGTPTYVVIYVDDLLVVGADAEKTEEVGRLISDHFQIKDLGEVSCYLGIHVEKGKDGSFMLHQRDKIIHLLEDLGMLDAKPVATPMETGFLASPPGESPPLPDNNAYRTAIGSLLYMANATRPDISTAVGYLCRRTEAPTEADWKSVKRVVRYLKGTIDYKLHYAASKTARLIGFVDSDWAGDRVDRKSTSGFLFQIGRSTVAWSSRKQGVVACSSSEAEYVAAAEAAKDLVWLRRIYEDLTGFPIDVPTILFEDNQGCIKMVESDRVSNKTKHIDVRYHFIKDLQERKVLQLVFRPSEEMVADILTKPLTRELHHQHRESIGLLCITPRTSQ